MPEYVIGRDGNDLVMKNYEGKIYRYYDPVEKPNADRLIN